MAQSNNIVYDDITGPFKRAYDAEQKFMGKVPPTKAKSSAPNYWDLQQQKMVEDSFKKDQSKNSGPKLGQKKKSKRKLAAKKSATKKRQ